MKKTHKKWPERRVKSRENIVKGKVMFQKADVINQV